MPTQGTPGPSAAVKSSVPGGHPHEEQQGTLPGPLQGQLPLTSSMPAKLAGGQ